MEMIKLKEIKIFFMQNKEKNERKIEWNEDEIINNRNETNDTNDFDCFFLVLLFSLYEKRHLIEYGQWHFCLDARFFWSFGSKQACYFRKAKFVFFLCFVWKNWFFLKITSSPYRIHTKVFRPQFQLINHFYHVGYFLPGSNLWGFDSIFSCPFLD